MAKQQEKTTFLVREVRFLPAVLLCFIPGLIIAIPVFIGFFSDPLGALAIAILPAILFFIGTPYATMLVRHRESGIGLREQGLYVNVWPYALGTVPYDNIAECSFVDYGVFQGLYLVLKDAYRIGDDLPGVLRLMRSMRANRGRIIRFSNFTFEDNLQTIHAAISTRLAQAPGTASPGTDARGGTGAEANSPDSDQFSCDKRLVVSYCILVVTLVFPCVIYLRADHIPAHGLSVSQMALAAAVVLVTIPLILGNILRIRNSLPAMILMKQGLYDNAWLFPLGAVPWDQVIRCEVLQYKSRKALVVFLSRPDEILGQFHWTYRLCRAISNLCIRWKDIRIPQIAVNADMDTLKEEIDRRLAAHRGDAPQEPAQE